MAVCMAAWPSRRIKQRLVKEEEQSWWQAGMPVLIFREQGSFLLTDEVRGGLNSGRLYAWATG